MEEQIIDYIKNNNTWKNFKEIYKKIIENKEYNCIFSDEIKHIINNNVNIIRFKINDKYEAKLNITNNEEDIIIQYEKEFSISIFENKWLVRMPFNITISNINSEIISEIDNDFNITEIYKNLIIDYIEFNKFCGLNNATIGNITINNINELDNFINKMIELFNKIIKKIEK